MTTMFSDNDEEEVFRLALGIDSQGMCLRHPNIRIVSSSSNNNETTNDGSVVGFEACKICRSELEAGGLKLQRKSMAYSIQAMQALHNDRVKWNNFKQNWGDGSNNNINEEEEDDDDNDETQQQVVNSEEEEKKDTKSLQEDGDPECLRESVHYPGADGAFQYSRNNTWLVDAGESGSLP